MPKLLLFCLVMLLIQPPDANAQMKKYRVRHFSTKDGLPQHSVLSIDMDQAGYCWLATEMGLARFDGDRFTVYNSNNLPGVKSNRFSLADKDSAGHLYFQNDLDERFIIDVAGDDQMSPVPRRLADTSMVCLMKGRSAYDRKLKTASQAFGERLSLYHVPDGGVYAVGDGRLFFYQGARFSLLHTYARYGEWKFFPVGDMFLLYSQGEQWKGWRGGALQEHVVFDGPITENASFRAGDFTCHYNNGGSYVFAGGSLYKIEFRDGKLCSTLLLDDLNINLVGDVYYHKQLETYFIGTLVSGLYVISPSEFTTLPVSREAEEEGFYSQVLTPDGDIISQRYRYRAGRAPVRLPISRATGASLFLSRTQQLYYGHESILSCYDLLRGKEKIICQLEKRPSSIFEDITDSSVIVVVTAEAIRKVVDGKVRSIQSLPIAGSVIRAVQTGKDSFLLATSLGLKWYDLQHNNIYRSVLDSFYIRTLHAESNDVVWIGTPNTGSFLYEHGKVYKIPDDGYPALQTIHSFIEDKCGMMWLPTNDGLFATPKVLLRQSILGDGIPYYFRYSEYHNLPTNEFNGGCTPNYLWLPDGRLSLPSLAGLVQFYPERIKTQMPDRGIYIDRILLNDSTALLNKKGLALPPDYGRLAIYINSPYYGDHYNLRMEVRIPQISKDWRPLPRDGKIELDGLAHGVYQVFVRKVSGGLQETGTDHKDTLTFKIFVRPHFYNTWWFSILVLSVLVSALIIFAKMRIALWRRRNRKLQDVIRRQTADLSDMVTQLKQSEQDLKESNLAKDSIITIVLHDLRSPIRFLSTISHQLSKKLRIMQHEEIEDNLSVIKSGVDSLNSFTDQFFAWAITQKQTFQIFEEKFNLNDLFRELDELYRDIISINNNTLHIHEAHLNVYTDKNILSVILRNLLDNANKHTLNGHIEIEAKENDEEVSIAVANVGRHLDVNKITEYYNSGKAAGQHGNGSLIVIDLLQKIGGKLIIEEYQEDGVVIRIGLLRRNAEA